MQKFFIQYKKTKFIALTALLLLFFIVPSVYALAEGQATSCGKIYYRYDNKNIPEPGTPAGVNVCVVGQFISEPECACCGKCELNDFIGLGINVVQFIFGITGSLALLMFIYGGFKFLTAAGNSEQIQSGKQILTNAIYGIIIILGAWVLINFVLAILTGQGEAAPLTNIIQGNWWELPVQVK